MLQHCVASNELGVPVPTVRTTPALWPQAAGIIWGLPSRLDSRIMHLLDSVAAPCPPLFICAVIMHH